jgi:HlyD family secretion protein
MKRIIIIILILAGLGAAGYFGYNFYQKQQQSAEDIYQTVKIERGSLQAVIGATGTVRANQTTNLSWQTSGRIGDIFVVLDDDVEANQVLADLNVDYLPQALILAQSDLISAQRDLKNLLDSDVAQSQAYQGYVSAQKALEDALEDRESLDYERASQNTIDLARSDLILAQDKVSKLEEDYDKSYAHLLEDDLVKAAFVTQLAAARKDRDRKLIQLNYLLSGPDQLDVEQADALIDVARSQLEDAKREWERLQDGPDPDDLAAAEVRIAAIEATINQAVIEAPFTGTITNVLSKKGDEVAPGLQSFRLDDLSHLFIDVEVPEVDINRVKVGQETNLSFDAILGNEYAGQVTEVARVGVNTQGVVNFNVTIELMEKDEEVRPGMTAAVNIVVSNVENALIVPNRAVRFLNGERIVYLLQDGEQVSVPIEIGSSSETYSEIIEGDIKEGDDVILNPQIEFNFGGPGGGPPGS